MVKKNYCCGTCRWHKHYVETGEWMCMCEGADEYGDYTDFNYYCDGWEEKRRKKDD